MRQNKPEDKPEDKPEGNGVKNIKETKLCRVRRRKRRAPAKIKQRLRNTKCQKNIPYAECVCVWGWGKAQAVGFKNNEIVAQKKNVKESRQNQERN